MYIQFDKVRYKNFLANGNDWTEISLNERSLTLVYGLNGAGKTTFIDAITFGLYGRAFRNINKPLLVNTINDADCIVEIFFRIGNKSYKVVRGIKPAIFEIWCDGVLRNQNSGVIDYQNHLEKEVLRFNFKTFKQIVVLGSKSFVPFMQLVAAERRMVIEDILYIQIYSSMARTTKLKIGVVEKEYDDIQRNIDIVKEKIALQNRNINDNAKRNRSKIDENVLEIEKYRETVANYKQCLLKSETDLDTFQQQANTEVLNHLQKERSSFTVLHTKIEQNIERIGKELDFYDNNDVCPTCKQTIEHSFKTDTMHKHECKVTEMGMGRDQLGTKLSEIEDKISKIETVLKQISQLKSEMSNKQTKIAQIQTWVKRLEEENEKIQNQVFDEGNCNELLKTFEEEMVTLEEQRWIVYEKKRYFEVAANMLKDSGIKTEIIKQYLPIINGYINSYLSFMEFHVNFSLDEEFEESIMSRHRDAFSYESFSDGEKLRIDLALLFAWRSVAKKKNSIDTNLLIMDEILDASYDISGIDDFFKLIRSMVDINIFIISPKGELILDKFSHIIKFEKKNSFSERIDA